MSDVTRHTMQGLIRKIWIGREGFWIMCLGEGNGKCGFLLF